MTTPPPTSVTLTGTPAQLVDLLELMRPALEVAAFAELDTVPPDDLLRDRPASELFAAALLGRLTLRLRQAGDLPPGVRRALKIISTSLAPLPFDCGRCGAEVGRWCSEDGQSVAAHRGRLGNGKARLS